MYLIVTHIFKLKKMLSSVPVLKRGINMKKAMFTVCLLLSALSVFLASCSDDSTDNTPEVFNDADRPTYEHDTNQDFMLLKPWNYDKSYNSSRVYPLVVSLHGGGGLHYAPCIVGNDKEMREHPCFFLSPTCSDWGSSAAWVRDLIETLKNEYRIDANRLYLIGFSMGGSGSYTFASAYYTEHNGLFAGIVRLAGQSQTTLSNAIAGKTSIWYHIGLDDTAERVTIAEQAYQFIKNYAGNASAAETSVTDMVGNYSRYTKTLTNNNIGIIKKSEYTGMGHDASVPFMDPTVLDWLFSQSLSKR
jgi:predicted peptidase